MVLLFLLTYLPTQNVKVQSAFIENEIKKTNINTILNELNDVLCKLL